MKKRAFFKLISFHHYRSFAGPLSVAGVFGSVSEAVFFSAFVAV